MGRIVPLPLETGTWRASPAAAVTRHANRPIQRHSILQHYGSLLFRTDSDNIAGPLIMGMACHASRRGGSTGQTSGRIARDLVE